MIAPESQIDAIDNCWNRIGVWGDRDCPELKTVIHCRNCVVYTNAAAQLLNRPLPSGYSQEWSKHYSETKETERLETYSAAIFRIGTEWLGLAAKVLQEVGARRPIHSLPHRRNGAVLGVVNVRGQLVVCVSLAAILGIEAAAPVKSAAKLATHERLLVVMHEGGRLVFPVEEVAGIERFDPEKMQPAPATLARAKGTYTKGLLNWQGKSVGLLDEQFLFKTLGGNLS